MLFVYLQATELRKPDFFKPITHTCTSIETVINSDVLWKPPDRNFPINSHTLASIRPRYGGNNDIMVTAGLLAECRRLWAGERKRHYVCVCVCVSWKGWETLASAGGKKPLRLFIKLFMESVCFTSGDFQRRERKGRIDEVRKTIVGERNEKMTAQ